MENIAGNKEIIMFYNVENFFPYDPKPAHRTDPTPSGLKNWDEWKYGQKLARISSVFSMLEDRTGKIPLLVGLSEIQGGEILEKLVSGGAFAGNYGYIHYESMDERGVDVAILYHKNLVEIIHSEPISFFFEKQEGIPGSYDTTRDVLLCKAKIFGQIINFFVMHLPSKRENDINKPKRDYILNHILKDRVEGILQKNEPVILMGDFNQNPEEDNFSPYYMDQKFFNPFADLYDGKIFSTFHRGEGLMFDQMLLSYHFSDPGFGVNFDNAEVYNPEQLSNARGKFSGEPFRTYAGTRYLGGYSDHFPIYSTFNFKK